MLADTADRPAPVVARHAGRGGWRRGGTSSACRSGSVVFDAMMRRNAGPGRSHRQRHLWFGVQHDATSRRNPLERRGCPRWAERGSCNPSSPVACPAVGAACSGGCRWRGRVITVVDVDAARRALGAGELTCPRPDCGGILRVWTAARPRTVRGLDATAVTFTPDRARCRRCKATNTLLPAWCLPRRGYRVEVVGAALLAAAEGAGYRRAAAGVGAPCW